MIKEAFVGFKVDPEFKNQLQNAAANLDMTMSQLVRKAVNTYIDTRIEVATNTYLSRAAKYIAKESTVSLEEQLEALTEGMHLRGMEAWGDPGVAPEDTFQEFVKMKLSLANNKKETVSASK